MTKYLGFLVFFFGISVAKAGILIEPYGGYAAGNFNSTMKVTPFTAADANFSGGIAGGRLGLSFFGLWVAGDYMSFSPSMTVNKPSGVTVSSISNKMAFVDAGFDFPFLFRFWGGYGVSNYLNYTSSNGTNGFEDTASGGTATKLGIGFKFLMFLSVNFEYINPTYKSLSSNKDGVSIYNGDMDARMSEYTAPFTVMTLSFPLTLF
jgi:hypothetical protein